MLFRRQVTVKLEKKDKSTNGAQEPFVEEMQFERKVDLTKRAITDLGAKMFLGVCVYIVLDTIRQTQVAKAYNPQS
jgi:hypothetical protein